MGVDWSWLYWCEFMISKIRLCMYVHVHVYICSCMFTSLFIERAKKQLHPSRNTHP